MAHVLLDSGGRFGFAEAGAPHLDQDGVPHQKSAIQSPGGGQYSPEAQLAACWV